MPFRDDRQPSSLGRRPRVRPSYLWLIVLGACSYDSISISGRDADVGPVAEGGSDAAADEAGSSAGDAGQRDAGEGGGIDTGDMDAAATQQDASDASQASDASDAVDGAGGDAGPLFVVEPYVAGFGTWNAYVKEAPSTSACARTNPDPCLRAGELRKVELPDETSCAGISAADSFGWFEWTCEPSEVGVRVRTFRLADGNTLATVLDPSKLGFLENFVTVSKDGAEIARTAEQVFWEDEVEAITHTPGQAESLLDGADTVYVIKKGATVAPIRITADGVSLIAEPGAAFEVVGSSSKAVLLAPATRFGLWLENLAFDVTAFDRGVELTADRVEVHTLSVSRSSSLGGSGTDLILDSQRGHFVDIASHGARDQGVRVSGVLYFIDGLTIENAQGTCAELMGSGGGYDGIRALGCGGMGLDIHNYYYAEMHDVRVERAASDGLVLRAMFESRLSDVVVSNSGQRGIFVSEWPATSEDSESDVFYDIVSTNNGSHGIVLRGRNQRLVAVTAVGNAGDGIRLEGNSTLLMHATALQNTGSGVIDVGGALGATLVNVVSANNGTGLTLAAGSTGGHIHDLFATDNGVDLQVAQGGNRFSGDLSISSATSCVVSAGLTLPGIADAPECMLLSPSDAALHTTRSAAGAFAGKLLDQDAVNGSSVDGQFEAVASTIDDWSTFAHPLRAWGKTGAFPSAALRGPCTGSDVCAVWDWRVKALGVLTDPRGATPTTALTDPSSVVTHGWDVTTEYACQRINSRWSTDVCVSSFVDYAVSRTAECLSDVECVLWRNLGSYPGGGTQNLYYGANELMIADFGTVYALWRYASNGL